jgi:hypothetical protein
MLESIRFALIVFITAVDSLLDELMLSVKATIHFGRRRLWIVQDKLISIWNGRRR